MIGAIESDQRRQPTSTTLRIVELGCIAAICCGLVQQAAACTCSGTTDMRAALDAFDAVFLGELVAEQADFPAGIVSKDRWVNFRVVASWKGVLGSEVGLLATAGGSFASCGFFGTVGEQYVMFLNTDESSGRYRVPICSWRGSEAAPELDSVTSRLVLSPGPDPFSPPLSVVPLCGIGVPFATALMVPILVGWTRLSPHL